MNSLHDKKRYFNSYTLLSILVRDLRYINNINYVYILSKEYGYLNGDERIWIFPTKGVQYKEVRRPRSTLRARHSLCKLIPKYTYS